MAGVAPKGDASVSVVAVFEAMTRLELPMRTCRPIKSLTVHVAAESPSTAGAVFATAVSVPVALPVVGVTLISAGPIIEILPSTSFPFRFGASL